MEGSSLGVRGMFRVNISNKDGTLAGDSGWMPNIVVRHGVNSFLRRFISSVLSNEDWVDGAALGSGTAAGFTTDALPGVLSGHTGHYTALGSNTTLISTGGASIASNYETLNMAFTWPAGWNSAQVTLANVGLYGSDGSDGLLIAGKTFASSACATDQQVTVTYQILMGGQTGT